MQSYHFFMLMYCSIFEIGFVHGVISSMLYRHGDKTGIVSKSIRTDIHAHACEGYATISLG